MASLHDGSETRYVVSVAHSAAEIKWLKKQDLGLVLGVGVATKDRNSNEYIRGAAHVPQFKDKGLRFSCFGHVLKKHNRYAGQE